MLKKGRILIVILLISPIIGLSQGTVIDEIVAVVGDHIILESDIEKQAIQFRQQGYYGKGDINCEVIEEQLYQKMLLNQAEIDSIEVTEAEVESQMQRRIQYFIGQLGSEQKLEEFYGKSIMEIKEEFRPIIADQIKSQRMQQELTKDVDVTPTDVRKYYNSIPRDSLPLINAKLQLQQIVRYPKVDEADILAVKERLQEFKKRIQNGERFATLAALYSEDEGTASKGGKLGYVGRGDLVPEFAAVAFRLEKGQISRIVKSEYGYHIIKLIDRKGEKINCRHILLKPQVKMEEKIETRRVLDSIRNKLLNDTLQWDEAVKMYSQDDDTRANKGLLINHQDGTSQFEKSQIKPNIAYAIKNLEEGGVSEPFEAEDDMRKTVYKIVRIKSKSEPHTANLIDDYQAIQEMALKQKKEEFVTDWIKRKRESTYIRISDKYKDCDYKYEWLK